VKPSPPESPTILRMAAPLVVSFWMRALFTFVDTVYAAIIGDAAVAAIGLTLPAEFILIALWVGLSTGLTSCLSRAMGAREGRKIEQYLRVTRTLILYVVPAFFALGVGIWFAAPRMNLASEVARSFQIYGSVLVAGSAISSFWSVLPDSIIKAHQDTRSTMWAGICSNVINIVLNTVFLFVFHWGVFGIALSTVIGRFGGLAYAQVRARHHERLRMAAGRDTRDELDPAPYRAILSLAIPSAVTFSLMSLETGAINYLLAGLGDATAAIAAYAIHYRMLLFMLNPIIAISVAMLPYVAKKCGERDVAGLRLGLTQASVATAVYCVAFAFPALILTAPTIAEWLAESPQTAEHAVFGLQIVPLACLVTAPFLICRPIFEGMQRGRPGLLMAVLRYVVLSVPLAWAGMQAALLVGAPGFHGLLVGLLLAALVTSVVFAAWVWQTVRRLTPGPGAAPGPAAESGAPAG